MHINHLQLAIISKRLPFLIANHHKTIRAACIKVRMNQNCDEKKNLYKAINMMIQ